MYTLEGEPNLKYNLLCAIDGNSSLKLVGEKYRHGTALQDERTRRIGCWIFEEDVDDFKDEVKKNAVVCIISQIYLTGVLQF